MRDQNLYKGEQRKGEVQSDIPKSLYRISHPTVKLSSRS